MEEKYTEFADRVGPAPRSVLAAGGMHVDLPFDVVLAMDDTGGIGKDGSLPWKLKGELAEFKRLTVGNGHCAVIMGRRTWESLPVRPLPLRANIVLSRSPIPNLPAGVQHATSLDEALALAEDAEQRFVIGGAQVYEKALRHPSCERVHLTQVQGDFGCDTDIAPGLIRERFENIAPPSRHHDGHGLRWATKLLGRRKPVTQEEADIRFARRFSVGYPDDVKFIRETLKKQLHVEISDEQAVYFWEWYSESYAAGWLYVRGYEDDEARVVSAFEHFVRSEV